MGRTTWASFHRRGDVLRAVVRHADAHRDGLLPTHLPGVAETFGDPADLVTTLQLRWHTRLSGHLERALADHPADPGDPGDAVVGAWRAAARDLPGVRLVLDRALADPGTEELGRVLRTARDREHALLAVAAGLAGPGDAAAPRLGGALEARARGGPAPVLAA